MDKNVKDVEQRLKRIRNLDKKSRRKIDQYDEALEQLQDQFEETCKQNQEKVKALKRRRHKEMESLQVENDLRAEEHESRLKDAVAEELDAVEDRLQSRYEKQLGSALVQRDREAAEREADREKKAGAQEEARQREAKERERRRNHDWIQDRTRRMERMDAADKLIKAMANEDDETVGCIFLGKKCALSELVCERDFAGMSPMHMAARKHRFDWLRTMVQANDKLEVFDQVTYTTSKPNAWTILHCSLDQFSAQCDEDNLIGLCTWLLRSMSPEALAHKTGSTGQNFVHFLAARGRMKLGYALVSALHTELGSERTEAILNATDKKGRGTVDVALKSNIEFADMLKTFRAKEQLPNPASGPVHEETRRHKRAEWANGYEQGWRDRNWKSWGWQWHNWEWSADKGWKWTHQAWFSWRTDSGSAQGSDANTQTVTQTKQEAPQDDQPPPKRDPSPHWGAGRW